MSAGTVVLTFHHLRKARHACERKYCVAPNRFADHMTVLARQGMQAVRLDAPFSALEGGPPRPAGGVVVTFDDDFRGVREHALPVMERIRWPFTVFLFSDLIWREDVWTRAANPSGITLPLLGASKIIDMQRRGVAFGSHTRSHASLTTLGDGALTHQLWRSLSQLAAMLRRYVQYLAYPFGDVDKRVEEATRPVGDRGVLSIQPRVYRADVSRPRIRRLDFYGIDTPATLMRKVRLAGGGV